MSSRVLRSTKLYVLYFLACAAFLLVMRLAFYLAFAHNLEDVPVADLRHAAYLGIKFDLRLAALMALPLGVCLCLPFFSFFHSRLLQNLAIVLTTMFFALVLCIYFFDFGFFSYLESRLSIAGLQFFENPIISYQMLSQSYPLFWIVVAYVILVVGHVFLLRILLRCVPPSHVVSRRWKNANFLVCFLLTALIIYGKLSTYSLRWSEAYFSSHPFVVSLALNPVIYLYETSAYSKREFDPEKTRKYYPVMAKYLGVDHPDSKNLSYKRHQTGVSMMQRPNIVIILLESLAADKTSLFDNALNPTPFLAALAKDGMVFKKCFTPTEATARGVFASLIGTPDVSSGRTSAKNPFVVNQNTIVNQFEDYDKFYFIGGSASWGNIRGVITHNIEGMKLFEEGQYNAPRNDVWGISDLALFKAANEVFVKQQRPFISFIQTAGFHRPYTIPKDSGGFEVVSYDQKTLEENGFHSLDQLNSLRFQDHALKTFFELGQQSPYFKNTIFIMLGDHGLPAAHTPTLPPGYNFYRLIAHHTPLVIYGPGWVQSGVSERVVSQVDVVATAATLAGQSYENTTLGRNILADDHSPSYAFLYSWHEVPPKLGLVGSEYYFVDSPQLKGLFRYGDEDFKKDWSQEKPEIYKEMSDLAHGWFYTSQYLLYNNPKL